MSSISVAKHKKKDQLVRVGLFSMMFAFGK